VKISSYSLYYFCKKQVLYFNQYIKEYLDYLS
jgi:hypothetical protein